MYIKEKLEDLILDDRSVVKIKVEVDGTETLEEGEVIAIDEVILHGRIIKHPRRYE